MPYPSAILAGLVISPTPSVSEAHHWRVEPPEVGEQFLSALQDPQLPSPPGQWQATRPSVLGGGS